MGMRKTFVNIAMEVRKKRDFCRMRTERREKIRSFPYRKIFLALLTVVSFSLGAWAFKSVSSIVSYDASSMKTPGASRLEKSDAEFEALSAFFRESALRLSAGAQVKWKEGTEKESMDYAFEVFSKHGKSSCLIDEIYRIKRSEDVFFYQAHCHPVDFPDKKFVMSAFPVKGAETQYELETAEEN